MLHCITYFLLYFEVNLSTQIGQTSWSLWTVFGASSPIGDIGGITSDDDLDACEQYYFVTQPNTNKHRHLRLEEREPMGGEGTKSSLTSPATLGIHIYLLWLIVSCIYESHIFFSSVLLSASRSVASSTNELIISLLSPNSYCSL